MIIIICVEIVFTIIVTVIITCLVMRKLDQAVEQHERMNTEAADEMRDAEEKQKLMMDMG